MTVSYTHLEIGRMEHSLSTKLAERANLARRREDAATAVRAAQPRVDELETVSYTHL